MKKIKNEQGFTLMEMLIVLFVIGALIMIIMPNLTNAGVQAQKKSCDANKKVILAQAEAYFLENGQQYPDKVQALVDANYLRDTPICPLNTDENKASYAFKVADGNSELSVKCEFHDKESE